MKSEYNLEEFLNIIDRFDRLSENLDKAYKHFNGLILKPDFQDEEHLNLLKVASRDVLIINTIEKNYLQKFANSRIIIIK